MAGPSGKPAKLTFNGTWDCLPCIRIYWRDTALLALSQLPSCLSGSWLSHCNIALVTAFLYLHHTLPYHFYFLALGHERYSFHQKRRGMVVGLPRDFGPRARAACLSRTLACSCFRPSSSLDRSTNEPTKYEYEYEL